MCAVLLPLSVRSVSSYLVENDLEGRQSRRRSEHRRIPAEGLEIPIVDCADVAGHMLPVELQSTAVAPGPPDQRAARDVSVSAAQYELPRLAGLAASHQRDLIHGEALRCVS